MKAMEEWAVRAGVLEQAGAPSSLRPVWKSDEEIGELIREIRKRCGLTQQRLAEDIGMPSGQADISKWESGKGGRPPYDVLAAVARLDGKDAHIFQRTAEGGYGSIINISGRGRGSRAREQSWVSYEVDRISDHPGDETDRWLDSIIAPDMLRRLAGTPTYRDVLLGALDTVSRRQWPAERKTAVQGKLNRMLEELDAAEQP